MKQFILVVSFAFISAFSGALAQADAQNQIQVEGNSAEQLIQALTQAGAQERTLVDLSTLSVSDLNVTAGEISSLKAVQYLQGPIGTSLVRLVNIQALGVKAEAVYRALEDAGVPATHGVDLSQIHVSSIDCSGGLIPHGPVCTITL